jgi:uncharacterized protein YodC (DUF2158 family)
MTEHLCYIREQDPSRDENWVVQDHNLKFITWFEDKVRSQPSEIIDETVKWLEYGPRMIVHTYQGYDMNEFTWYTKRQHGKSTIQNSGVTLVALSGNESISTDSYYGWIEEIWEIDYVIFRIPLFLCTWIENQRGVRKGK